MMAMQYSFTLPADYDMEIIDRRIRDKGPAMDGFLHLGFKAFLSARRGESGSRENLYAPFLSLGSAGRRQQLHLQPRLCCADRRLLPAAHSPLDRLECADLIGSRQRPLCLQRTVPYRTACLSARLTAARGCPGKAGSQRQTCARPHYRL